MGALFALLAAAAVAALVPALAPRLAALVRGLPSLFRPGFPGAHAHPLDRFLASRRLEEMRVRLPEALLAMASSVRAGLSLPQAIPAAAGRVGGRLGRELERVSGDLAMGGTLETALAGLGRRVPLPEMRLALGGLNLARSTGAPLAPLLDRISAAVRERERLRGQLRTMTAQGRLSGWVVGLMPPVLVVVMAVIDPEFMRPLVATPAGWLLLAAAAVMELLGMLAIRAVVRVEG